MDEVIPYIEKIPTAKKTATMSHWGLGGAFRAFSTRMFGDDLAGELDPSITSSSAGPVTERPSSSLDSGPVPIRSFPENVAVVTRPAELSPDQLQHSMKQLMRYPKLWTMYKEELSQQEHPTHPETVRRVLIEFLEKHGHEMIPTTPLKKPPKSTSIFQAWNMGLEEESTHVSRTRPALSLPNKNDDDLQSRMKRLMGLPELWVRYKQLLSQEETPDRPDTIRRLFVEFWKEHEEQILRLEAAAIHPLPAGSSSTKRQIGPASIFHGLNTDLDGESQHVLSTNSASRRFSTATSSKHSSQQTTQHQLRILRSSPALYAKYQERLLMDESEEDTPAADLLTKFLKEHEMELTELDQADQEAKRQAALDASLLHLETATFAEEEAERKFTRTTRDNREQDRRQTFTAYRDSMSSQSMRGVQEAMEALAVETVQGSSAHSTSSAPLTSTPHIDNPLSTGGLSSQSEHPRLSKDRRQKFMAYRDSISSRSVRGVQGAMEALAGEATTDSSTLPSLSTENPNNGHDSFTLGMGMSSIGSSVGDMNSTIASLAAWGSTFSLKNVSNFVTHEMENMTSELGDNISMSRLRSQTTEDLELQGNPFPPETGRLHSSMPTMRFDIQMVEEDDEEDLMLQEASKIAMRHRLMNNHNSTVLDVIVDEGDEDTADATSVSERGDITHKEMKRSVAIESPMSANEMQNEKREGNVDLSQEVEEKGDKIEVGGTNDGLEDSNDEDSLI